MTVESEDSRVSYTGAGSTGPFTIPFYFLANADIRAIKVTIADGTEDELALTTDFTLTGAGDENGGELTLVSSLSSSYRLVIFRDPDLLQEADYTPNDDFPAETHERALDKLTMIAQRIKSLLVRSVTQPDGDVDPISTLPPAATRANKALVFDADGDVTVSTDDYEDQAADAAASAAAAASSASAAATSATAAASSASSASTSATAAASSAISAAASATAAQTAADSVMWQDVVFITSADSPYSATSAHRGKLLAVDCSSGAVSINLPSIASLSLVDPFVVGIKKTDASGNAVTINRDGTDTIDGAATKVISAAGAGTTLIPDTDPSPDQWTSMDFGAAAGNMTADRFVAGVDFTSGVDDELTLSVQPGAKNNTTVTFDGVVQHVDQYSLSGTDITFTEAIPAGVSVVEVKVGTTLSIGTPADGSVTSAKTHPDIGGFKRTLVYTSSATWTKASGLKRIRVQVVGGGGAGGGCAATSAAQTSVGKSGAGGGTSIKVIEAASLGTTETVTIGAGGSQGSAGASGGSGGTSYFGSHCSATGGAGGSVAGPGGELNVAGVAGGIGVGGDINISGQPSSAVICWGGHFVIQPTAGGSTHGNPNYAVAGSNPGASPPAGNYGAGGTGASNDVSQSARQGGAGSDGVIIVEEFY